MLFLHIIIALASISHAVWTFVRPSSRKVWASYGLVVVTAFSGIALIFVNQASILHTCVSGLIFCSVATVLTVTARGKLNHLGAEDTEGIQGVAGVATTGTERTE